MKNSFIIISFLFLIGCSDPLESDYNFVRYEELVGNWNLSEVIYTDAFGAQLSLVPSVNHSLTLQPGGIYVMEDPESLIQMEFDENMWEFPDEGVTPRILFDKGVSTYNEQDFFERYLAYRVLKTPIHIFDYEVADDSLTLTSYDPDKLYNYGFIYGYDYAYLMLLEANGTETYDEGVDLGYIVGYYYGLGEALDQQNDDIIDAMLEKDPLTVALGDGFYEYNYDFDFETQLLNFPVDFEDGFYAGFDVGLEEAYAIDFSVLLEDTEYLPTLELIFD